MDRKTLIMFGMLALAAAVVISGCTTQAPTQNTQTTNTTGGAAGSNSTTSNSALSGALAAGAGSQTSDYDLISTQDTIASP